MSCMCPIEDVLKLLGATAQGVEYSPQFPPNLSLLSYANRVVFAWTTDSTQTGVTGSRKQLRWLFVVRCSPSRDTADVREEQTQCPFMSPKEYKLLFELIDGNELPLLSMSCSRKHTQRELNSRRNKIQLYRFHGDQAANGFITCDFLFFFSLLKSVL